MPQADCPAVYSSATQGPDVQPRNSWAIWHGSALQQYPQPLQGSPDGGLGWSYGPFTASAGP